MGYGNNWNMYNNWNRPGMQEGYRYNYGKRSADAEPEADADAWYRSYGYSNFGHPMNYNNWNMYNRNWNMYSNMYNRPSFTQYRTFYHKRSADAEAEADAWYQPYGYSNWGYNQWNRNNMMSYWNRPYNMYSNYRFYHY